METSQQEETYLVWPTKIGRILMIGLYLTRTVYFFAMACQYLIEMKNVRAYEKSVTLNKLYLVQRLYEI